MITETITPPPTTQAPPMGGYLLKLLAGPIAFALVVALPMPISYQGRIALATFICAIVWWMTEPMPWAVAAMLPFLVFPAAGVMDIAATMRLYGQPIFFWIMGTTLMGYAIEKHGLAQRIALGFLALPGIGGRTARLMFAYMTITGVISMFVSDAATVAMTIPIGMSLVWHVGTLAGAQQGRSNFAAFITLGTFYAAVAGGTATIMGVPHNAIALSVLQQATGRQLGFFEWMEAGVPVFVALLVAFYAVLWWLVPPETREIPNAEAFLRTERARLGPIRPNERRVLFVFAMMVVLFTLPTFVALLLGGRHPVAAVVNRALSVWVVPPAVMFLLFTIRSADHPGEALVTWKDTGQHAPWNSMFLVGGAVAMTDALTQFGFVEVMGRAIKDLGVGQVALPFIAASFVGITTNFISATALYCSVFIPAAAQIGFNPASMAILIANTAVGVVFPWAGATSATAFAAGEVSLDKMIRLGVIATVLLILVVAVIHLMMAPVL
jgi:solute carrier family 13 (sodium-dependent dicarboxylate transporter), member 2/3/5